MSYDYATFNFSACKSKEFGFGKLQEPYEAEELSPLEGKVSAKRLLKRY